MSGHAVRGMLSAWLGLIVLQAAGSSKNSGRVVGLFADVNRLVKRALDPSVPAIPDRRTGGAGAWTASGGPFTPGASPNNIPGAHPGAQINPSTGAAVGYGY